LARKDWDFCLFLIDFSLFLKYLANILFFAPTKQRMNNKHKTTTNSIQTSQKVKPAGATIPAQKQKRTLGGMPGIAFSCFADTSLQLMLTVELETQMKYYERNEHLKLLESTKCGYETYHIFGLVLEYKGKAKDQRLLIEKLEKLKESGYTLDQSKYEVHEFKVLGLVDFKFRGKLTGGTKRIFGNDCEGLGSIKYFSNKYTIRFVFKNGDVYTKQEGKRAIGKNIVVRTKVDRC
jgi:hypothetical protein